MHSVSVEVQHACRGCHVGPGPESVLRRFGPGRTLEWASAGARKADREAAQDG